MCTYIVTPAGSRDLIDEILQCSRKPDHILDLCLQVLSGVVELHKLKIAHQDIKPDNFVLDQSGTIVKLIDFDSAY